MKHSAIDDDNLIALEKAIGEHRKGQDDAIDLFIEDAKARVTKIINRVLIAVLAIDAIVFVVYLFLKGAR